VGQQLVGARRPVRVFREAQDFEGAPREPGCGDGVASLGVETGL
jgi:hypothetical protein